MSNPKHYSVDAITGETVEREMTTEELEAIAQETANEAPLFDFPAE